MEGRHKDGDPSNNRLANLEWSTHVDNMRDQYDHGTRIIGESHPRTKLTDEQVRQIHHLANTGNRGIGRELAEQFGVTAASVSQIKKMQTRKAAL
jgi:DNA-binding MarR family transcriptional regulator